MTDFIANCGEPEYEEVVVIKMFNGMLGALDFDCFFSPLFFLRSLSSNVRGRYYCNNKKTALTFILTNGLESARDMDWFSLWWN